MLWYANDVIVTISNTWNIQKSGIESESARLVIRLLQMALGTLARIYLTAWNVVVSKKIERYA